MEAECGCACREDGPRQLGDGAEAGPHICALRLARQRLPAGGKALHEVTIAMSSSLELYQLFGRFSL